jgi:hypothetical protein
MRRIAQTPEEQGDEPRRDDGLCHGAASIAPSSALSEGIAGHVMPTSALQPEDRSPRAWRSSRRHKVVSPVPTRSSSRHDQGGCRQQRHQRVSPPPIGPDGRLHQERQPRATQITDDRHPWRATRRRRHGLARPGSHHDGCYRCPRWPTPGRAIGPGRAAAPAATGGRSPGGGAGIGAAAIAVWAPQCPDSRRGYGRWHTCG